MEDSLGKISDVQNGNNNGLELDLLEDEQASTASLKSTTGTVGDIHEDEEEERVSELKEGRVPLPPRTLGPRQLNMSRTLRIMSFVCKN
jgi:hypothetical protein